MDDHQQNIARQCLEGAERGSMSFPQIIGRLIEAGFESYSVDFRRATAVYYLPDGQGIELVCRASTVAVAPDFDVAAIRVAIGEAQALVPGYSYNGFCDKVRRAGCAGYMVSFPGRRAVYYGRTAETHVETFPPQA
ncbi:protein of unknown function [Magnetospirillum gryphiswaldense MSR-1 v2]|uniref:DUF1398 domain-containing protein n=1 Tax=Magnetospirillum gryphiswaldense (strain DSM 6361 / JCM 21280 / NBRC 15271 / MSR-1) TaxID=431944 RepID=V6EXW7_MAGGM|nr:DUF1398 family protein [Magnetospirillum gryphiswaldense]CDK97977.1 protein of unknown function [Magnetospirillum gryphiswaldense MSR-1 v2]